MILDLQLRALLKAHNDPTVDAIEIDAICSADETASRSPTTMTPWTWSRATTTMT
jgi:16S rRNA C967 or C1407 C5-methylase (RsmB/RsmF family)